MVICGSVWSGDVVCDLCMCIFLHICHLCMFMGLEYVYMYVCI